MIKNVMFCGSLIAEVGASTATETEDKVERPSMHANNVGEVLLLVSGSKYFRFRELSPGSGYSTSLRFLINYQDYICILILPSLQRTLSEPLISFCPLPQDRIIAAHLL